MTRSFLAVFLFVIALSVQPAWAEEAPEEFVERVKNEVVGVFNDQTLDAKGRELVLHDLFDRYVAVDWIGRFVLGKYWRQANNEQRKKYELLYRDYLKHNYVSKFDNYNGAVVETLRVQEIDGGSWLVATSVDLAGETVPLRVDYRLRKEGNGYQIIDISGEGVSLINTQRTDFGSAISRKGLDFFLSRLEAKVSKLLTAKAEQL